MMKGPTVIRAKNISKTYRLYDQPMDRVKESLSLLRKQYHKDFYALNDVSFELKKGESLGIIGRNGDGKSTLVKIVAGVLTPTEGQCKSSGRISAILELTSNLKPELTGLENIALNLKISGFKKKEIENKVKEIEDFAEIGEFINQPVKVYSSGMKSRLGFGIAASSEPDILILDEVLAVGDFNFQQKCLARINAMRQKMSMIFVSHSMNSVRLFCDRVLVLNKGSLVFDGQPKDAISFYLEQEENRKKEFSKKSNYLGNIKEFYGDLFHNRQKIVDVAFSWNKKKYKNNEEFILYFSFKLKFKPKNLIIGVPIWDENGQMITGISNDMKEVRIQPEPNVTYHGKLKINNIINPGKYINILSIYDGAEALYRQLGEFETKNSDHRVFGVVTLEHEWVLNER